MTLARAQVKDKELRDARKTLEDLLQHSSEPTLLACKVEVAALERDPASALETLRVMCSAGMQDPEPLQSARDAMVAGGWVLDTIRVLEKALEESTPNEHVGPVWAQTCVRTHSWHVGPRLGALHAGGKLDERSIAAYLEALGDGRERTGFRRFQRRHEALLRKSTNLWGWTGYVLMRLNKTCEVARWLADWRDRADAEPWMLLNLVLALRRLHREAEAEEVSRHALTLPEDHTSWSHQAWVAFGDALAGRIEEARALTKILEGKELPSGCKFLYKLSDILIDLQALPGKPGRKPDPIFRRWWRAPNFCRGYKKDLPLRRAYWACGRKVARACGGLSGWAWYVIATCAWGMGTDLKRWFARNLRG
jgi:hypothetical protein